MAPLPVLAASSHWPLHGRGILRFFCVFIETFELVDKWFGHCIQRGHLIWSYRDVYIVHVFNYWVVLLVLDTV